MTPDDVTIETLPSGTGVRIIVDDSASDSLAIIEVRSRSDLLSARVGLRGNFDARWRPMRWMSTVMDAPPVKESERLRRKAEALRRLGQ
jgi:hypothetical protein